jgi:Flp pilus assembly protein protease CpaA
MPEQLVEHLLYAVSLLFSEVLIYSFFKCLPTLALELHFSMRGFPAPTHRAPKPLALNVNALALLSTSSSACSYAWLVWVVAAPTQSALIWGVLIAFLVPLAVLDAYTRTIPNALLVRLLVAFLLSGALACATSLTCALLKPPDWGGGAFDTFHQALVEASAWALSYATPHAVDSLLGFAIVGGISYLAWHLGAGNGTLGGGDVKLFALLGLMLGVHAALTLMVVALLAVLLYTFARRLVALSAAPGRPAPDATRSHPLTQSAPLAPAVLFAAAVCMAVGVA